MPGATSLASRAIGGYNLTGQAVGCKALDPAAAQRDRVLAPGWGGWTGSDREALCEH